MSTRRRTPLTEDSLGLRPGHPLPATDVLSCAAAALELNTTSQTVRTLIERDDLAGYWQRVGRIYRFWVYRHAVQQFVASFGRFPAAQKAIAAQRRPRSAVASHEWDRNAAAYTGKLEQRILELQETVRCQSAVIDKLHQAMREQESVSLLLRRAETAGARATALMREANDAYSRLLALEGVPDDPSGIIPDV